MDFGMNTVIRKK